VLLVEDVATTGGSMVKAIKILREQGAVVERAIVVVDRQEGGAQNLEPLNVRLESLVKASELLEINQ